LKQRGRREKNKSSRNGAFGVNDYNFLPFGATGARRRRDNKAFRRELLTKEKRRKEKRKKRCSAGYQGRRRYPAATGQRDDTGGLHQREKRKEERKKEEIRLPCARNPETGRRPRRAQTTAILIAHKKKGRKEGPTSAGATCPQAALAQLAPSEELFRAGGAP